MLKSIRQITGQKIDLQLLETYYKERDTLKKRKNSKNNRDLIRSYQKKIYDMMYIPQYITVVMESIQDYHKIFENGFIFNNKLYRRFSCSASQARVSTVVFVEDSIHKELKRRLDNGRKMDKPLAPSKYNAYFGLYSSAIKEVRKPRFCIVPDYEEECPVDVDFVIETPPNDDDIIEPRTIPVTFNRFDGSGIISPQMAELWGKDLGEDYTPCQFCIRWAFTKGMVNEFDFVEWCKEENDGNYLIKDVYGNYVDLREIDVILSEGQVKLWNFWDSQKDIEDNAERNGLVWGVTKYTPKQDKDASTSNYQFLQTLNISDEQIKAVCQDTVDYIQGVSYDNVYYSLLFMLGEGKDKSSLEAFMRNSDNYWLKTLILNHNLLCDKYSKTKIREMIIRQIELACLGKLVLRGNFQCIVPDNYAYMEWIVGKPVKGLLNGHEFYSQYWNNLGVDVVDGMRSPLTHFSEHNRMKLIKNERTEKWFKYSYSGIIVNTHDEHTMNFAGSDYDFDILYTTNSQPFLDGKYQNQRVVTYTAKKPQKRLFTESDLFITDTFSFGTLIGSITNKTSSCIGMMANFSPDSEEYKLLANRVKMGCAA